MIAVSDNPVHKTRELTEAETEKLKGDTNLLSQFKRDKLEKEARKNWDLFYKRNSTNFFKDRHWIGREFNELSRFKQEEQLNVCCQERKVLLEVGCGVGNTVFPLMEENPDFMVHCCDFSQRAIDFIKQHPQFDASKCYPFQCDVTVDPIANTVENESVDIVTLFFVLSAISPEKMPPVLTNIYKILKPGGIILFRDYGLYDHAMLRFGRGHKIAENFYVRQDGTRAYYFSLDVTRDLFSRGGYEVIENYYVHKTTENKKEGLCVPRVFIQGKFQKPFVSEPKVGDSTELETIDDVMSTQQLRS